MRVSIKMPYRKLLIIVVILLSAIFLGCRKEIGFTGKPVNPPPATRQLGPAVFFPELIFNSLDISEGSVALLEHKDKKLEVRIYKFFEEGNVFGMYKEFADSLNLISGENNKIRIIFISQDKAELKPKPIKFSVENYKGNLAEWKGYAFGAPHGDCDNETGSVVKLVSERYGIPSTAAYGCRLSYRGIWYDCNRPLMKEPHSNGRGVIPERQWNDKAVEKYQIYQDSVWANSGMKYGDRFELFTSFHGHDLTVKLSSGKTIQRPVIEGIAVGFTKNEIREIKNYYYRNRKNYFANPPDLYFGNLPEDAYYEYQGIKLKFFYSGLGTRTYGSLRSDLVKHALHFETPNSMRYKPEERKSSARLLFDLYKFAKDSILTFKTNKPVKVKFKENNNYKILVASGEFLMGASQGMGWSGERPRHKVYLDSYYIDAYEVTNKRFAVFLNSVFEAGEIIVNDGIVYSKDNPAHILFRTAESAPMSEINFSDNKFKVITGREYFPVIFVSFYGAESFAEYYGDRLPTEAEWEKAASWDSDKKKKYFYSVSSNKITEGCANYEDSGDPFENYKAAATAPVGFFDSGSPSGAKDMSGNVWEWCSDYYKYDYYSADRNRDWKNPAGPDSGTMKSIRGGAWNDEYLVTRTTMRLGINPNAALVNLGFRCVNSTTPKGHNR